MLDLEQNIDYCNKIIEIICQRKIVKRNSWNQQQAKLL